MDTGRESAKVFVAKIPYFVSQEKIQTVFEQYGPVLETKMLFHDDGAFRGCAFIKYASDESAHNSLALDGLTVFSQETLVVRVAEDKRTYQKKKEENAFQFQQNQQVMYREGLKRNPLFDDAHSYFSSDSEKIGLSNRGTRLSTGAAVTRPKATLFNGSSAAATAAAATATLPKFRPASQAAYGPRAPNNASSLHHAAQAHHFAQGAILSADHVTAHGKPQQPQLHQGGAEYAAAAAHAHQGNYEAAHYVPHVTQFGQHIRNGAPAGVGTGNGEKQGNGDGMESTMTGLEQAGGAPLGTESGVDGVMWDYNGAAEMYGAQEEWHNGLLPSWPMGTWGKWTDCGPTAIGDGKKGMPQLDAGMPQMMTDMVDMATDLTGEQLPGLGAVMSFGANFSTSHNQSLMENNFSPHLPQAPASNGAHAHHSHHQVPHTSISHIPHVAPNHHVPSSNGHGLFMGPPAAMHGPSLGGVAASAHNNHNVPQFMHDNQWGPHSHLGSSFARSDTPPLPPNQDLLTKTDTTVVTTIHNGNSSGSNDNDEDGRSSANTSPRMQQQHREKDEFCGFNQTSLLLHNFQNPGLLNPMYRAEQRSVGLTRPAPLKIPIESRPFEWKTRNLPVLNGFIHFQQSPLATRTPIASRFGTEDNKLKPCSSF